MSAEFCDTNILVYAYDQSAGAKHDQAHRLVVRLWESGNGVLSVQVLQEFFVSLTRRVAQPLPIADARAIVADMATWQVVVPAADDVLEAIDATARWRIAFWDAMILTAARKAGAAIVWSEDLNNGQAYNGVVVRNPLRDAPKG